MRRRVLAIVSGWLLAAPCIAAPTTDADALEARTRALSEQLRCLVCQNQTIADSQAQLAVDLRRHVREQLAQGRTDEQVISSVVQRYGDFVLYRPPFKASTWLLWAAPLLLLVGGMGTLLRRLRHPRDVPDTPSPEDLAHAARLLDNKESP